jgi:acyl carrier protein
MTTKTEIRQYIVENWLSGDSRGFADDTDLQQTGVLDSFTTLALIGFLESQYGIRLDPADISADAFRSVDTLTQLVEAKRGEGKQQ